ncbi:MAG: hypothetical protein Q4P33_05730, partial [Flaviflexus sp.]|nr:hypothetical protein [Flaviflexus sp.]
MKAADGDTWDPLVDGEEHPLPGATPRPPAAGSPAQPPRQSDTDPGPPLTVGEGRGLVRRPGHRHLRNPLRPRTLDEPSGAQTGSDEPREKLASEIPAALSARKVDRGESGRRDER